MIMYRSKGILAAAALSLVVAGCSSLNTPVVPPPGDNYAAYYDDYYGTFYDGYWGNDGYFWYADANHGWHRDEGHHFARTMSAGFHAIHGSGVPREH
jgi:hypothetical protein